MLSFRDVDHAQMRQVETALERTLAPFKENTEAALAIFALLRCARVLLRLYPAATQRHLLPVLTAFLEGQATAPGVDDDGARLLIQ